MEKTSSAKGGLPGQAFRELSTLLARRGDSDVAPIKAAEAWSHRAQGPWYDLGPAWPSTWIEYAASLDSACRQPDGERIETWHPSLD